MSENSERTVGNGNLTPFQPGQSGNLEGRPKGSKDGLQAKVRRLLRTKAPAEVVKILRNYGYEPDDPTYADAVSIVAVHQAMQGEIPAIKLLKEMDEEGIGGSGGNLGGSINIQINAAPSKEKSETHEVTINGIPVIRNNGHND